MEQRISSIDSARTPPPPREDSGLVCFVLLARLHGVAADAAQLRHEYLQGEQAFGIAEMLRSAKHLGLKARSVSSNWDRLSATALPAIARFHDGRFMLVGRCAGNQVLIHDTTTNRPAALGKDEFLAVWSGELLLCSRRAKLFAAGSVFDISWFIAALNKYRRLFADVLVASLRPATARVGHATVLSGGDRQGAGPPGAHDP